MIRKQFDREMNVNMFLLIKAEIIGSVNIPLIMLMQVTQNRHGKMVLRNFMVLYHLDACTCFTYNHILSITFFSSI